MQVRRIFTIIMCLAVSCIIFTSNAQSIVSDSEKQKQWKSMENGPWDFAPDWYYFFLHKKYSGAEMYWNGTGSTLDSVSVSRNQSLM